MTTEAKIEVGVEERCSLVLIAFLERNDFTDIQQVSQHVIKAKDGRRLVYIWVCPQATMVPGEPPKLSIPAELFHLAELDRARVDVIAINAKGDRAEIKHMMNASPA